MMHVDGPRGLTNPQDLAGLGDLSDLTDLDDLTDLGDESPHGNVTPFTPRAAMPATGDSPTLTLWRRPGPAGSTTVALEPAL
ncbi:MAG: hypothetical protein FWE15_22010, partial [Actinomycetia bacterium]|nr:hypothetical protein [Actinomycetes bacterium]